MGECFGTFEAIDGQTMHKTMLMVHTKDATCEFLKVTTSDYQRVIEVCIPRTTLLYGLFKRVVSTFSQFFLKLFIHKCAETGFYVVKSNLEQ